MKDGRLASWQQGTTSQRTSPAAYWCRFYPEMSAHDIGDRTCICPKCRALHFRSKRVKGSSIIAQRFQTCCKDELHVLESILHPPEFLRWLWTSEEREGKEFRRKVGEYNSALPFTSFNHSEENRLEAQSQRGRVRSLTIYCVLYLKIGTVASPGLDL